ncbi:MAG: DNA-directed DNA polymerase [Candidatus Woesearchaeota archaeon]
MKIEFYPLEIAGKVREEGASVIMYGRDKNGDPIAVEYSKFNPYFWAVPEDKKTLSGHKISSIRELRITRKNGTTATISAAEVFRKNLVGREVEAVRVEFRNPSDSEAFAEEIKKMGFSVLEEDIPFSKKFLIDNEIVPCCLCEAEGEFVNRKSRVPVFEASALKCFSEETIPKLKVLAFDIETYNPQGKMAIPEKDPILMCSFYSHNFKKVITWKRFKTKEDYIEFVKDERELIERFKQVIIEHKPDIITGYFSDGFDLPYLKKRAEENRVELDIGMDYSTIAVSHGQISTCRVVGIAHIDVFKFVRNTVARGLETTYLDLNSVASELLDERKEEVEIEKLASAWDNNPEELEAFCRYNLQDSALTYKLLEKTLENLMELIKIVGMPAFEVSRMGPSQIVEWFLIKEAKNFNELIPNKPDHQEVRIRKAQTYPGAFVFEPQPGLYSNIVVFDFRSLYPSIITTHNISPDTLNCECCRSSKEDVPELDYWFCKKKRGFISTVINELITRRMRIKEILKGANEHDKKLLNARQNALKTIANSMYGYMGFFAARWYCIECAKSITAYGRYYIKKVIDKATENGFKVLYSDTDSIFFTLGDKRREDAEHFLNQINRELPGTMEMELEDFYPRGIFVSAKAGSYGAKKKYALISASGRLKIRGFETVRRNWSIIGKEVQAKVLRMILERGEGEAAFKYVRQIIEKLKEKKIPNEQLIIYTQLQKGVDEYNSVGPHVAVAQRMKELRKVVGPGTIIPYIVVEGKGRIRDRAKLPEEAEEGSYDSEYYISNQIIPSVGRIFEVLGYEEEELVGGAQGEKQQRNLSSFFK